MFVFSCIDKYTASTSVVFLPIDEYLDISIS